MKKALLTISLLTLFIFTGCSTNQNNLHSHKIPKQKNKTDKYDYSKDKFIKSLKKELSTKRYNHSNTIEDELFIYKQLMKQNF